jgi:hypothetical protein
MRKWYKCMPPKYIQKNICEVYKGIWMPQMDKYWESDDGYSVMSRQIRTDWGKVEHISIQRFGAARGGDVPWMVKQEIKNELFGEDRVAIEVFPTEKNLVDMCDVYHLWLLPKEMKLPFGIHPTRDPNCKPVERGMDFNMETVKAWMDSTERKVIMGEQDGNERTD